MLSGFVESFKAKHPDVTVKFETIPPGDYTQKLTFQLAGGNRPTPAWLMEDAAPTLRCGGRAGKPRPDIEQAPQGYDFADFSKPALGLWTAGDEVYGVPFSTSPFVIFYNKDHVRQGAAWTTRMRWRPRASGTWRSSRRWRRSSKDATGKWGFEFKDGQGYDTRIMHALMPPIRACRRGRVGQQAMRLRQAGGGGGRHSSCTTWCSRTSRSCHPASRGTASPATRR